MSIIIENCLYQIDSSGSMDPFERVNFRHSLGKIKNTTLAWLCFVFFSYLGHAKQARDNRGDETRQVCKLCKFVCNFPWKMKSRSKRQSSSRETRASDIWRSRSVDAISNFGSLTFVFLKRALPSKEKRCRSAIRTFSMAILVVEFSNGGTKSKRFLPKNQHTQRKLLNF